jgi:hypothetical protein
MKDKDFRAITESEYPWRIELCLTSDPPLNFTGASADITHENAITLTRLLMKRFMAEQTIATPIIVSKTMTEEQIKQETNRLTTVLTMKEPELNPLEIRQDGSAKTFVDQDPNEKRKQVNLSITEKDVLSILLDRELYGLVIWDKLNLNRAKEVEFSNLYFVLNQLEEKGLVFWRSSAEPSSLLRKSYKITDAGVFALIHSTTPEKKVSLHSKIWNFLKNLVNND